MTGSHISVEILDVLLYQEKKRRRYTKARSFYALSFRLEGESIFRTAQGTAVARTDSIALVPEGMDYERDTTGETIAVFHFLLRGAVVNTLEVYTPQSAERYRAMFLDALRIWEEKPKGYYYAATAIFYRILAAMAEDGMLLFEGTSGLAEQAAEYLGRHFGEKTLTVERLAKRFYVSEPYLRRMFRARYGVSPKAYLDRLRIEHAISLLETGYYSQKEISDRSGYGDVKYFRTAFKAKTGRTPSAYIRSLTEKSI